MKKVHHSKIYESASKDFQKKFDQMAKDAKNIMITSHMGPDDDSISSVLSTYIYLQKYLKIPSRNIKMMYSGKKLDRWSYFLNFEKVKFVSDIEKHSKKFDLIICLDGGGWKRFSKNEKMRNYEGNTVCIDHHPTIEGEFSLHLVDGSSPACALLIYELFFEREKNLSKELCEILMLGIIGDTGSFTYIRPEESETLNIAARLVKEGEIKVEALKSKYDTINSNSFKVLAHAMSNAEIISKKNWPDFMCSYIRRSFVKNNNLTYDEVDEGAHLFTRYLRSVDGGTWGFVVRPSSDELSGASFRSIPNSVNVRDMLERMGVGGGHDRAAGGKFKIKDTKRVMMKIINWMESNKPEIS